jgi:hypothetical protein
LLFERLTCEAALKRILSNLDHGLVYNEKEAVAGVVLLGRSPGAPAEYDSGGGTLGRSGHRISFSTSGKDGDPAFRIVPNTASREPNTEPIDMTVIKNAVFLESPKASPVDTSIRENTWPL